VKSLLEALGLIKRIDEPNRGSSSSTIRERSAGISSARSRAAWR